eukprot:4789251-Amphidinium_carterae.1
MHCNQLLLSTKWSWRQLIQSQNRRQDFYGITCDIFSETLAHIHCKNEFHALGVGVRQTSTFHLVKALLDFQTLIKACKLLCLSCQWSILWYEMEDTGRPITQLYPKHVSCMPLAGHTLQSHHLWPPQRAVRTPAPKRPRRPQHPRTSEDESAERHDQHMLDGADDHSDQDSEEEEEVLGVLDAEAEEAEENMLSENLDILMRAEAIAELYMEAHQSER